MPIDDRPYSFEAVYPIEAAVQLAQDVKADPENVITHSKHAAGIIGCVLEKHDTDPEPFGAIAASEQFEDMGEAELCDKILECCAPQGEAEVNGSIIIPILLPLISALLQRLLARWGR